MIPQWVITLVTEWILGKKTGSITINFFKGGVTNIVKQESIKG